MGVPTNYRIIFLVRDLGISFPALSFHRVTRGSDVDYNPYYVNISITSVPGIDLYIVCAIINAKLISKFN